MSMASIGSRNSDEATDVSLLQNFQTGSESLPASYSLDTGCSFSGVKRPGHEADHEPPSSAEYQNEWRYNSRLLI